MTQVRPSTADITQVKQALASGRWIKSRHLVSLGIEKRKIRAVAQATGEVISSQQGYKLTSFASDAEIERAQADLMSRSRKIAARAERLQRFISRTWPNRQILSGDQQNRDLFL